MTSKKGYLPYDIKYTTKLDPDGSVVMDLPTSPSSVLNKSIQDSLGTGDKSIHKKWSEITKQANKMRKLLSALEPQEEEKYARYLKHNDTELKPFVPSFKQGIVNTSKLAAITKIRARLSKGRDLTVPLYSSGIWVTITSPTETELVNLQRQLLQDRIMLGRRSYGLSHSATTVYTVETIMYFILDHMRPVYIGKTKDVNNELTMDMLSVMDIDLIIAYMVSTMFPEGFGISRTCSNDIASCTATTSASLDILEIIYPVISKFSEEQLEFIRKTASKTPENDDDFGIAELTNYQKSLVEPEQHDLLKDDDVVASFTLSTCSMEDYFASGKSWIEGVVASVDDSLSEDLESRNKHIELISKTSTLRQYSHFVKELTIVEGAESITYTDKDIIDSLIGELSEDDDVRNDFFKKVVSFVTKSKVSLVGIPEYVCPTCKAPNGNNEDGDGLGIIPLDLIQVFFTLLGYKISLLTER